MIIVIVRVYKRGRHLSISWAISGPLYQIRVVHAFLVYRDSDEIESMIPISA